MLPWLTSLMARRGEGSAFATRVVDCAVIGADSRRVLKFVGAESVWCAQEFRAEVCTGAGPGADGRAGAMFIVGAGIVGGVVGPPPAAADVLGAGAVTEARADDEAADEGTVDLLASSAEISCDRCLSVRVSWSSSSLTSFQEHLACFFVHPIHAVKFFKQSIWRRRQRSHGGRIRSPRCSSSIRATISILCGPPSSFSGWLDLGGGSNEDGVLGIATVVGDELFKRLISPAASDARGRGRDEDCRFTCTPPGGSS